MAILVKDMPMVLVEEVAAAKSHAFVLAFVLSLLVPYYYRRSLLQRAVLSLSYVGHGRQQTATRSPSLTTSLWHKKELEPNCHG